MGNFIHALSQDTVQPHLKRNVAGRIKTELFNRRQDRMVLIPGNIGINLNEVKMPVSLADDNIFGVVFEMTTQLRATGQNTGPGKTPRINFLPPCKTILTWDLENLKSVSCPRTLQSLLLCSLCSLGLLCCLMPSVYGLQHVSVSSTQ